MPKHYVVSAVAAITLLAGALTLFAFPWPAFLSGHTPSSSFPTSSSDSSPAAKTPYPSAPVPPLGSRNRQNPHMLPSSADTAGNTTGGNASANPGQSPAPGNGPSVPSQVVPKGAADIIWSLPIKQRAVFITIDDGWFPSQSLLQIMQQEHLPVTAFLIQQAAEEHPDYWRAFLAAGGSIENHTFSHPDLTHLPFDTAEGQIRSAETYLTTLGPAPTLFRPPYGDYNSTVCQAVYQAGIKHVIMWNAVMSGDVVQTYNGKPIQSGSIILLHWVPGLGAEIQRLLDILYQNHLGVASLPQALAQPDNFPVVWPDNNNPSSKRSNQPAAGNKAKLPALPPSSPSSGDAANGA